MERIFYVSLARSQSGMEACRNPDGISIGLSDNKQKLHLCRWLCHLQHA
ncbi:hypothetical protein [Prevotella dentasini]|nr:hypothetical protein [Prevotella dentasini]